MTIKLQAPLTVEIAVSIINDATGQQGVATYSLAKGRFHDEASLREGLASFESKHMPEGFRLMTKREWFNSEFGQVPEDDGDGNIEYINVAMPGGENWEEPPNPDDFPLGKACDLSGEGDCEACQ